MNTPLKIRQPRFLTRDEVLSLHRASIDMYGGADGVLDDGALESALARPRQAFGGEFAHEFPFGMAAAYGYHLAMNHAFRDGNKRTAFAAMVVFLRMNGWNFELADEHAADMMLEMIAEHRDKAWLTEKLVAASRARPSLELRDFFAALDPQHLTDLNNAAQRSNNPELAASVREAATAIPLLCSLFEVIEAQRSNPDPGYLLVPCAQVTLLVHLFRAAEELGYEW